MGAVPFHLIQLIFAQWYLYWVFHFAIAQHNYTPGQAHVLKHLFTTNVQHEFRHVFRLFARRINAWYP